MGLVYGLVLVGDAMDLEDVKIVALAVISCWLFLQAVEMVSS
jgi:hypothetical protein